jgi:hypothetical protein
VGIGTSALLIAVRAVMTFLYIMRRRVRLGRTADVTHDPATDHPAQKPTQ